MNTTTISIAFPDLDSPEANEQAESLLSELRQDAELKGHLDLDQTGVKRTDREAQDFGVTLIAVLGTPAIIILAKAVKSWVERTGTTSIELNGVRIKNVRSQDAAAIAKMLESNPGSPRK
jgi:Effector Associated Constant Component 1